MELQDAVITKVLSAGVVYSPKGRSMQMQRRLYYGLSFCTDGGRITYTQDGVDYVEDRAHAVLLPQGQSYHLRGDATGNFPVINFSTLEPLCQRITVLEVRNGDYLFKCFDQMEKLFAAGGSRPKILSLFYEMMHELSFSQGDELLSPAMRYLYENYASFGLTNALLARQCRVSEVYFRKLFKEKTGLSPKQYVLNLRLQKAKRLLAEGKEKIWAVASACGFENSGHFCKSFKEQVGMTPGEYRKSNQMFGI